ncbi:MAG: glycosyltransferase family 1 protein [Pseudomonadota bacterium]
MRVLVATDAWRPQINGVVHTYLHLVDAVRPLGAELELLTPDDYATVPCPMYSEIRLAVPGYCLTARRIEDTHPDAIHIATEGPIGWMTRRWCRANGMPYTTSFHTRFPEYLWGRFGVPSSLVYAFERRFHNTGAGMMVATHSLAVDLQSRGFENIRPWTRGVDTRRFRPAPVRHFGADPVFLYVGRVAREKNLEAFLSLDLPGRKVVVGTGPEAPRLATRFPDAFFAGRKSAAELADCYASADVFVFPSRTDTFGIVLLEAMASGLPIAAFPVTGPIDIVSPGVTGILDEDLARAAMAAMGLDRNRIRAEAERFSWDTAARQFLANLVPARATSLSSVAAG